MEVSKRALIETKANGEFLVVDIVGSFLRLTGSLTIQLKGRSCWQWTEERAPRNLMGICLNLSRRSGRAQWTLRITNAPSYKHYKQSPLELFRHQDGPMRQCVTHRSRITTQRASNTTHRSIMSNTKALHSQRAYDFINSCLSHMLMADGGARSRLASGRSIQFACNVKAADGMGTRRSSIQAGYKPPSERFAKQSSSLRLPESVVNFVNKRVQYCCVDIR